MSHRILIPTLRTFEEVNGHPNEIVFVQGIVRGSKGQYSLELDEGKVIAMDRSLDDSVGQQVIVAAVVAHEQPAQHRQGAIGETLQQAAPGPGVAPAQSVPVLRYVRVLQRGVNMEGRRE